jgi:hypothetical protein
MPTFDEAAAANQIDSTGKLNAVYADMSPETKALFAEKNISPEYKYALVGIDNPRSRYTGQREEVSRSTGKWTGEFTGYNQADDTISYYDSSGKETRRVSAHPSTGGGGWLNSFLGDPLGTVSNTVSDFVQNPSHAIGEAWNTGGRDAAIAAGTVWAAMNGVDPTILSGLGETTGADALVSGIVEGGGEEALSGLDALATGAGETVAATGALPVTGAATSALPVTSTAEMVASGTAPGAAGATGAVTGVLSPADLAAASGVVTNGALPELVEMATKGAQDYLDSGGSQLSGHGGGPNGTDIFRDTSINQGVASGSSPGSLGADLAVKGELTKDALNALYGVSSSSNLNLSDLTKGASTFNDLLNSFKKGAKLGSLDGSDSSGSGSRLGSDLARVGQMGSGNPLLHSVQGLYSGAPTGYAEGGSTSSGLDSYNPLMKDVVKVGDVGKSIPLTRELASLYGDNVLAHGGQPHVDPRLMALIRARANPADKQHPNYDGTPVFRTGGLEGLGGKYVEGKGDGQSDDIPAMLADGEYVFDAQTVADFGNGSNKAGAKMLDAMREAIRAHKRNSPLDSIPPKSKTPQQYLMDARKYLKGVK